LEVHRKATQTSAKMIILGIQEIACRDQLVYTNKLSNVCELCVSCQLNMTRKRTYVRM